MAITIKELLAKKVSYGGKRDLNSVKYIVIHYTGNVGDTAEGNAKYFATSNTRPAGAHFFVGKDGEIFKSISMSYTAWSVGGIYSTANGAGSYYGKCTNSNSVSIELCDCIKGTSWEQMKATKQLVEYIQKQCPNAKTVIRHWDVNGKACPAPMVGRFSESWKRFKNFITKGYQFKAEVIKKATLRTAGKVTAKKIHTVEPGTTVYITKIVGNWGRLKNKTADGNYKWISLKKVKEV